jgi:hypothetical protein
MTFNLIHIQTLEIESALHGYDLPLNQLLFFHIGYCNILFMAGPNLEFCSTRYGGQCQEVQWGHNWKIFCSIKIEAFRKL